MQTSINLDHEIILYVVFTLYISILLYNFYVVVFTKNKPVRGTACNLLNKGS